MPSLILNFIKKKKKKKHARQLNFEFQKKKIVAYLDLNKAHFGTVSNDTIPVDKWSG